MERATVEALVRPVLDSIDWAVDDATHWGVACDLALGWPWWFDLMAERYVRTHGPP